MTSLTLFQLRAPAGLWNTGLWHCPRRLRTLSPFLLQSVASWSLIHPSPLSSVSCHTLTDELRREQGSLSSVSQGENPQEIGEISGGIVEPRNRLQTHNDASIASGIMRDWAGFCLLWVVIVDQLSGGKEMERQKDSALAKWEL